MIHPLDVFSPGGTDETRFQSIYLMVDGFSSQGALCIFWLVQLLIWCLFLPLSTILKLHYLAFANFSSF